MEENKDVVINEETVNVEQEEEAGLSPDNIASPSNFGAVACC